MSDAHESAERLRTGLRRATHGLVDREVLAELVLLCAVAGEHLLVVGPPGTAKSEAVRRVARVLGGTYFEYLLGRFTEPSELFGPVDLRKLKDGLVETRTEGMLPEAELAFLDEVFLGSTAILNTLLGLLNERAFRRGHTAIASPLRLCVGATNALPDDDTLAAFSDRFLARCFVGPVADPQLEELLAGGWSLARAPLESVATIADVDAVAAHARTMSLDAVRPLLAEALRTLKSAGLSLSDRRAVKAQKLIAAAAALGGRDDATPADLWPLVFVLPTEDAQERGRDALSKLLETSVNETLSASSEAASQGPAARAHRLAADGTRLLALDTNETGTRLKLEGLLREIDATFETPALTNELATIRRDVAAKLGQAT